MSASSQSLEPAERAWGTKEKNIEKGLFIRCFWFPLLSFSFRESLIRAPLGPHFVLSSLFSFVGSSFAS